MGCPSEEQIQDRLLRQRAARERARKLSCLKSLSARCHVVHIAIRTFGFGIKIILFTLCFCGRTGNLVDPDDHSSALCPKPSLNDGRQLEAGLKLGRVTQYEDRVCSTVTSKTASMRYCLGLRDLRRPPTSEPFN